MMNFEEIKKYWEHRASQDTSVQSTTQDVFLREIEFNTLNSLFKKYSPSCAADFGCGDGHIAIGLASKYRDIQFVGFDYSSAMIENAKKLLSSHNLSNVEFVHHDICNRPSQTFDLIYTTRCLINLPSWDLQKVAIKNIHDSLNYNGIYIMIENFIEGHENFNKIRLKFGLPEISIRDHNFFFSHNSLIEYMNCIFDIEEEINISSTYYLVSRVIYSKMCFDAGKKPDYFDDHHRYAAELPFCGEYGPVRLICCRKK